MDLFLVVLAVLGIVTVILSSLRKGGIRRGLQRTADHRATCRKEVCLDFAHFGELDGGESLPTNSRGQIIGTR